MLLEIVDKTTFDEVSFAREYESIWQGSAVDSFFSGDLFDRRRNIRQVEYARSKNASKDTYYILGVDVA